MCLFGAMKNCSGKSFRSDIDALYFESYLYCDLICYSLFSWYVSVLNCVNLMAQTYWKAIFLRVKPVADASYALCRLWFFSGTILLMITLCCIASPLLARKSDPKVMHNFIDDYDCLDLFTCVLLTVLNQVLCICIWLFCCGKRRTERINNVTGIPFSWGAL